MKKVVFEHKF